MPLTGRKVNSFYLGICCCLVSHKVVSDSFFIPWIVVRQASLSIGFPRQECWSGLLFPNPGDLPKLATESMSPVYPALVGRFFTTEPPRTPYYSDIKSDSNLNWHLCIKLSICVYMHVHKTYVAYSLITLFHWR